MFSFTDVCLNCLLNALFMYVKLKVQSSHICRVIEIAKLKQTEFLKIIFFFFFIYTIFSCSSFLLRLLNFLILFLSFQFEIHIFSTLFGIMPFIVEGKLHGPSMFAVMAKIYGVLYKQSSSIAFDETSSYWSAFKNSQFLGFSLVTTR